MELVHKWIDNLLLRLVNADTKEALLRHRYWCGRKMTLRATWKFIRTEYEKQYIRRLMQKHNSASKALVAYSSKRR